MDKRTILFILAFGLAMFGINLYFQKQNMEKRQEWQEQQNAIKETKEQKNSADIVRRTAKEESLPLVRLYSDREQTNYLIGAVADGGNILALSWTKELPAIIYSGKESQEYKLIYRNHKNVFGAPVIYQKTSGTSTPLEIVTLPSFGKYDIQLVSFHEGDLSHPFGITLGTVTDGHFAVMRDHLVETGEEKTNRYKYIAAALFKTDHGYLPIGLYDAKKQSLTQLQDTNEIYPFLKISELEQKPSTNKGEEKLYVLENEYQQLVFSNVGGALSEINLPFRNESNQKSVVREIEFDRDMVQNHPYNAHFPGKPYYTASNNKDGKPKLQQQGKLGGYYPLLRRNLIEKAPRKSIFIKPSYYACNIVSEYPELAEMVYEVKKFDNSSITFESSQGHRRITKTYSFEESKDAPYCINLEINIEGDSRGLWITSGIPEVEWISGGPAPALKYRITRNQQAEVEKIDFPTDAVTVTSIYPDWICNSNGFLGMIQDPLKETDPGYRVQHVSGLLAPSRLIEIGEDYDRFKPADLPGYMTLLPLKSTGGAMQFRFFAGPFDSNILNQIDELYSDPSIKYNPDYIACQTMHGWFTFISEPFAKFLAIIMNFFHYLSGSWALSIVLLTVVLRILLYPLNAWSTKSMIKMQQIAPDIATIQEKYKKEPKKAQLEIMSLYRERGINPASGCLPLLIQMPFLIGMFDLLKSSFALRGAPFIPGWINDLTAPDVLFKWSQPIFFIGNEFHLLPFFLGAVMFVQQRFMSTAPKDPSLMTDQQRQQKAMSSIMTVVFTLMFYNFPSGLNIYWLSSMLLGMLQQWYMQKFMPAPKPVIVTVPNKKGKKR